MNINDVVQLITYLNIAITNSAIYSEKHDTVISNTDKCIKLMGKIFEDDRIEIMRIGGDLVVNDTPIKVDNIHINNFIRRLKRRGLEKIDITVGLNRGELYGFIVDISKPVDKPSKQSPHISSGRVEVMLGTSETVIDKETLDNLKSLTEEVSDIGEEKKSADICYFKQINVSGLEDVVIDFIAAFKREANILNILVPFKTATEFTYIHMTNVSVLSMFQAEALGISDDVVHDVGIAALLHDIGKMFINTEVLSKTEKLTDTDWREIQSHTIKGSKYLLGIEGVPQLAPIGALEHHMRYDGSGYPKISGYNHKNQHIISQIIAISDFYDALRQKRPYKEGFTDRKIIQLMYKGVEKDFNPLLVNNFIERMKPFLK